MTILILMRLPICCAYSQSDREPQRRRLITGEFRIVPTVLSSRARSSQPLGCLVSRACYNPKMKTRAFDALDNKYRGVLSGQRYTICLGAGISIGLIPNWFELARRVVNAAFSTTYDPGDFRRIINDTSWSLDACIQAAANHFMLTGRPIDEFDSLIEEVIYADLRSQARSCGLENALIQALNNPRYLKKDEILGLCDFFEHQFPDSSLIALARVLALAYQVGKLPDAIITFNADTLLYAILDLFLIRDNSRSKGLFEQPSTTYRKVLRGIRGLPGAVPIYHCHGAIAPQPILPKANRRDSRDKLVFRESDYLQLSGNFASWAQNIFLFHAQSTRLLIIGHSMSDPNIRRWLSWTQDNYVAEMTAVGKAGKAAPQHFWLNKKPKDNGLKIVQEVGLSHLGIRLCWVDEWSQLHKGVQNILAV